VVVLGLIFLDIFRSMKKKSPFLRACTSGYHNMLMTAYKEARLTFKRHWLVILIGQRLRTARKKMALHIKQALCNSAAQNFLLREKKRAHSFMAFLYQIIKSTALCRYNYLLASVSITFRGALKLTTFSAICKTLSARHETRKKT
jgi:hypothetical protein